MSLMTPENAAMRIKNSQAALAVFRVDGPLSEEKVNVVFADTVRTRKWINRGKPDLIGVFSRNDKGDMLSRLKQK